MGTKLEKHEKNIKQWQQDYSEYNNSGDSFASFSRKLGIRPNALKHRFQQVEKYHALQSRFVPVRLESPLPHIPAIEPTLCTLDLGNGRQLRIHHEGLALDLIKMIRSL
jgi:hypothetical protein